MAVRGVISVLSGD